MLSYSVWVDIVNSIIKNVLTALYQPFWAAMLMAFSSMFVYLYAKEHQWKINDFFENVIKVWWKEFRSSPSFRRIFLLVFYTTMILFRTLLNRQVWFDPLEKIMGGWSLYAEDGTLTTEAIENFMLFVPFTMLFLWSLRRKLFSNHLQLRNVLWVSFKVVGIFSLSIECLQVLLYVGTFQLSDLFYNTLGGILAGVLYFVLYKIKCRELLR